MSVLHCGSLNCLTPNDILTQCHFCIITLKQCKQEFDNIINYLTPSAKKLGVAHTDGSKKSISYEQKITSCQNLYV